MTFNYQVGGSLPADAPSYVERQCDRQYYDLLMAGKYCYVFNCRQMGKSSLRVRVMQKLRESGVVSATIDPQSIGTKITQQQWYTGALNSLVREFDLRNRVDLRKWLKERDLLSPIQWFAEFIEEVLLKEIDTPIVIFVEEIDRFLSMDFSMNDFFALMRSLSEDRQTKPHLQRITFSFLGVATPSDLIRGNDQNSQASIHVSTFNIGEAVEMTGFTVEEALPLMHGLGRLVTNPQEYLAAAIYWSGGQPFLTQKLLAMIEQELGKGSPPSNVGAWLEELVQSQIVFNWEAQDLPQHLTTIRDRVLSVEEKLRGRMLGCYQQVLEHGALDDDYSEERSKLCLTGLVVRREGKLRSYNPIYGAVFNNKWVEGQLADLRPEFYASAFREWEGAEQKGSFLLRGEALGNAEEWARGKRLSDADEEFLRQSREVEKLERNLKLAAEQQAREIAEEKAIILGEAKLQADRRVLVGSGVLAVTLLLAAVAGVWATKFVDEANVKVVTAQKKADDIQKVSERDARNAAQKVMDANQKKKEADLKVEEAKKSLRLAQSELENVSYQSEEKILAAELKVEEALQKQMEADQSVEEAKAEQRAALAERQQAIIEAQQAQLATQLDRASVTASSLFERDQIGGVLDALRLAKFLQNKFTNSSISKYPTGSPLVTLNTLLNNIQEKNRINLSQNSAWKAKFSPDGQLFATAGADGSVCVWTTGGKFLYRFPARQFRNNMSGIKDLSFTSNGKQIVTVGEDGALRVWSISGQLKKEITEYDAKILSVSISGERVLIGGVKGTWLIDLTSGKRTILTHPSLNLHSNAVSFSPDGNFFAVAGDNGIGYLFDVSGQLKKEFTGYKDSIFSIAFSPDGQKLVTAGRDRKARLWDITYEKPIATFSGHQRDIFSVDFSPDGAKIVTSSWDGTARVWDISGQQLTILRGHTSWVGSSQFSQDGKTILTTGYDDTARLWHWDVGRSLEAELIGHQAGYIKGIDYTQDGQKIVTAGDTDGTVRIWNRTGEQVDKLEVFPPFQDLRVLDVSFSPSEEKVAIVAQDGQIRIWNLSTKKVQTFLRGGDPRSRRTNYSGRISFSSDGHFIISTIDGTAKVWNLSGQQVQEFREGNIWVNDAVFSKDGQMVATAGEDGKVRIWNFNGKLIYKFVDNKKNIHKIHFSPDGEKIVTAGSDGKARIRTISGDLIKELRADPQWLENVSFSPDGLTIATGGADGIVKLWTLSGQQLADFSATKGKGTVFSISFSSDGKQLATGGEDGVGRLWRVDNLDRLLGRGCQWINDYLTTNPNASDEDRQMCNIPPRQK